MDFTFNDEQQMIQKMCREFAEEEIKPRAEEMDRTGEFPYEIVRKMADLGLLGLPFPEEYGGAGADYLATVWRWRRSGGATPRWASRWRRIRRLARRHSISSAAKSRSRRILPPLARGERLWSFGLTEPGAGSDSGGTETRAEKSKGIVEDQRREELHHQRGHGDVRRRHDHGGDGYAAGRAQGDHELSSCRRGRRAISLARRITRWGGAPRIHAR